MATFNLGAIRFNWKGAYNNGTAYVVDDVVSSGGNSYICILASTGNAVSNATYWSIMSSAGTDGTDGTDLTSTITTQGDVLYRDGSGLQRLAKGTASQSLTMNSGATAPEWTTPAGGGAWNLIDSVTVSNVASINYSSLKITSTYDNYAFFGTGVNHGGMGNYHAMIRVSTDGGTNWKSGSDDYVYNAHRDAEGSEHSYYEIGEDGMYLGNMGYSATSTTRRSETFVLYFHDPLSTVFPFYITGNSYQCDNDSTKSAINTATHNIGAYYRSDASGTLGASVNGIQFLIKSGNIVQGKFSLYGLSKS